MKTKELISLRNYNGMIIASIYNRSECYYYSRRFLWYPKKEIISELRSEGVICRKKAYEKIY